MPNPLRTLPSVNELITSPQLRSWIDRASLTTVVAAARRVLDEVRNQWRGKGGEAAFPSPAELIDRITQWVKHEEHQRLVPVINATGVLLPDALGRAPLAEDAIQAAARVSRTYCSLEVDLDSGESTSRQTAIARLLTDLTGAAAATAVNNQAAALQLILSSIAGTHEVLIARSDLLDMGDSYRWSNALQSSGATIREVGSVNRTTLQDYSESITAQTRLIVRVERGSEVSGSSPSLEELAKLGRSRGIPVLVSVPLGSLIDLRAVGIEDARPLDQVVATGVDLVVVSGDKLIGGPQSGLVLGKAPLIRTLEQSPWFRAIRLDRGSLAALETTLRLYQDPSLAMHRIPVLALLDTPLENLKLRAHALVERLLTSTILSELEARPGIAELGIWSGCPSTLLSWQVTAKSPKGSVERLAKRLRQSTPPVLCQISGDKIVLDLRTCQPGDEARFAELIESWQSQSDVAEEPVLEPTSPGSPTLDAALSSRDVDSGSTGDVSQEAVSSPPVSPQSDGSSHC